MTNRLVVRKLPSYTPLPSSVIWAESLIVSHFGNALSMSLAFAEPMVMQAVKYSMPHLSKERLIDAEKFIEQESNHVDFHLDWNAHLIDIGYVQLVAVKKALFAKFGSYLHSDLEQELLVLSVIFEHITYHVACYFLGYLKQHHDEVDPVIAYMWGYHAVEEIEHKAVCFNCCLACFNTRAEMQQVIRKLWPDCSGYIIQSLIKTLYYLVYRDSTLEERGKLTPDDMKNFLENQVKLSKNSVELNSILAEDFNPADVNDTVIIAYWDNELGPYLLDRSKKC